MLSFILYGVGAMVIVISLIVGCLQETFLGFVLSVVSGLSSSAVFFALGKILDNQESILLRLGHFEGYGKRNKNLPKTTCPKCSREHDEDYTSCPYCGHRY
jgi:hypothetical protein